MSDHDDIEATAAAWIARHDRGELSEQETAAFDAWLSASTAHRVCYLRLNAGWERTQRMRALAHRDDLMQVPSQGEDKDQAPVPMPVPAQGKPLRENRWRVAALAASLVLSAAIGWQGWQYWQSIYRTDVGAMQSVPLPDGSQIAMNTASEIRIDVSQRYRSVELRGGEVFFDVAKDVARPFVVRAGTADIEVVGTQFAVHRDGDQLAILVSEGHVRVRPARGMGRTTDLVLGQHAVISSAGIQIRHLSESELQDALAWRRGMLVFRDTPLSNAVAEFNRYREIPIVIADSQLAQMRIGGTFRTTNASGFLRLLEQGFQIRAVSSDNAIVLTGS